MDPILSKLVWVFGAVVVYGLLRWRLMCATHEFRIRAGVDACAFSQEVAAKGAEGRVLALLAERAYRPTTPWLLVLALIGGVVRPNLGQRPVPPEVRQLNVRVFWALISTSPLASLLAAFVLAVALLWRNYTEVVRDGINAAMGRVHVRPYAASI